MSTWGQGLCLFRSGISAVPAIMSDPEQGLDKWMDEWMTPNTKTNVSAEEWQALWRGGLHKWHKRNTRFPFDRNWSFTPRREAFQFTIWQWSLTTPETREKPLLRKNWAEKLRAGFVAAPNGSEWYTKTTDPERLGGGRGGRNILRLENLEMGSANTFPALRISPFKRHPLSPTAQPLPRLHPKARPRTCCPAPSFFTPSNIFSHGTPPRLWLSDHRDFGAVQLLSPDPPRHSMTPDPLLQPALTVQIMFQIHPRSHLEAKQSNFRSAPEVTEKQQALKLLSLGWSLSALKRRASALSKLFAGTHPPDVETFPFA